MLALLQPVQALNPAVPQRNLATCRPSLRLHAFGGDQPQLRFAKSFIALAVLRVCLIL